LTGIYNPEGLKGIFVSWAQRNICLLEEYNIPEGLKTGIFVPLEQRLAVLENPLPHAGRIVLWDAE